MSLFTVTCLWTVNHITGSFNGLENDDQVQAETFQKHVWKPSSFIVVVKVEPERAFDLIGVLEKIGQVENKSSERSY